VAEFGDASARHRFVLEFVRGRRDHGQPDATRGFLRITMEGCAGRRLDMASIPHVRIDSIEDRLFIAGSTRIAQTWTEALRHEAERGRRSFVEQRHAHSHLFRQLDQAGLATLHKVSIQWGESALPFLLDSEPAEVSESLKRVLLALEDRSVRRVLAARDVVRLDGGNIPIYLDIAQVGRVLELSLGQPRRRTDVDAFLARMPVLTATVHGVEKTRPLAGVRVFLVHHLTGEVLALIAALRALGCRDLACLFINYAGEAPASYLDAVLSLPDDEFRALALVNVPTQGHVEGRYRPSTEYSRLEEADEIAHAVRSRQDHYLDAMRAAAIVSFLRQVARAEAAGGPCFLIEDGGYLGPILNEAMLGGLSMRSFAERHGHSCADERPVADVLRPLMIGSVEHTRNGYDRLVDVERKFGRLSMPAFSIAVSHLKREVESKEVAASILNAIETVLNADGLVLSRRRCLVVGSLGSIGKALCEGLSTRLEHARELARIDLKVTAAGAAGTCEAKTLAELPAGAWLGTDLVIGVTGDSVLRGSDLEAWLLESPRRTLILASGSTKKVEFRHVMEWLDGLLQSPSPAVQGRAASVVVEELLDPRTARVYAQRYVITIDGVNGPRALICLSNLTPVNFLFYGVPTEIIDHVLAQLLSVSLGLRRRTGDPTLESRLHAVDLDIDPDGRPLITRRPPV
jgi:S-adenosylhomocysteine hydrolase